MCRCIRTGPYTATAHADELRSGSRPWDSRLALMLAQLWPPGFCLLEPSHRTDSNDAAPIVAEAGMSEQGWRAFIGADGLEDWVVLHGGATAVFTVASMGDAVALAAALAEIPELLGSGVLLTAGDEHLTVRLTRGVFRIEERYIGLARRVSEVARAHGAPADRSKTQEVQVAVAAKPEEIDVAFWRAVLGYATLDEDNGVDPLGHSSTVWMQGLDGNKQLRHAMHVDVSLAREHSEARVAAAVAAGGRVVEDSSPDAWILADQAGNKVCVASWPDAGFMNQ